MYALKMRITELQMNTKDRRNKFSLLNHCRTGILSLSDIYKHRTVSSMMQIQVRFIVSWHCKWMICASYHNLRYRLLYQVMSFMNEARTWLVARRLVTSGMSYTDISFWVLRYGWVPGGVFYLIWKSGHSRLRSRDSTLLKTWYRSRSVMTFQVNRSVSACTTTSRVA